MNVTNGATVDAEFNYWGSSTGPYHNLNPEGEGNLVNGDGTDLDFIPFEFFPIGVINERPTAVLEVDPCDLMFNETVTFNATGSFDDDGRIDYYFFDFGDGTNSSWTTLSVVIHEYAEAGTYNATLVVMDNFGGTSFDGSLPYAEITVVPEFPSFLILPIFMILTLLSAVLYKRHKRVSSKE